jgi:hypothetical protein
MTDHPVTPPFELIEEWIEQFEGDHPIYVAIQAAKWGADQELEACCEWLEDWVGNDSYAIPMRAARRPKPPNLKEQALKTLKCLESESPFKEPRFETIRRALETLPE